MSTILIAILSALAGGMVGSTVTVIVMCVVRACK